MMNVSFVPSIYIHRPIILTAIQKSMFVRFFPHKKILFPAIFDFHFGENPRFRDEFQALKINSFLTKQIQLDYLPCFR